MKEIIVSLENSGPGTKVTISSKKTDFSGCKALAGKVGTITSIRAVKDIKGIESSVAVIIDDTKQQYTFTNISLKIVTPTIDILLLKLDELEKQWMN